MSITISIFAKNFSKAFGVSFDRDVAPDAEKCFELTKREIEGVKPLTLYKIKALYKVLFSDELKKNSDAHREETYHVARIVSYLYHICLPLKENEGNFLIKEVYSGRGDTRKIRGKLEGKERTLFIFKKQKDEGIRLGVPTFGSCKREQLAYLLDHKHLAGVRPTLYLDLPKLGKGSAQIYERECKSFQDISTSGLNEEKKMRLRQIAVFYTQIANQDGHAGNILVRQDTEVFSIDHGFSLPEKNAHAANSVEMFPQQSRDPFTKEEAAEISSIEERSTLLKQHGLSEEALFVYRVAHLLLKSVSERVIKGDSFSPYDLCILRNIYEMEIIPGSGAGWTRTPSRYIPKSESRFQYMCEVTTLDAAKSRIDQSLDELIHIKKGEALETLKYDKTLQAIQKEYKK